METIAGHLYDYPKYYDLIFGSDWAEEFRFLKQCFEKYASRPVTRVFEPACGTGRLLIQFAKSGYEVAGNDLNEKAIEYCNQRLQRHGFVPTAFVGDMAAFTVKKKYDAAFNLINTFRHLPDEATAEAHLKCVADALNKGGLYLLGLHLTPKTPQKCTSETWSAKRGKLSVVSNLWSAGTDLKKRVERIGVTYDVTTPSSKFRIKDETVFRTYTSEQMFDLLATEPRLRLVELFDFRHDIDWPVDITADTEDVIYLLKRI
jgi:SAM-dependent methyltransferase